LQAAGKEFIEIELGHSKDKVAISTQAEIATYLRFQRKT